MAFQLLGLDWPQLALVAGALIFVASLLKLVKPSKNITNAALILAVVGVIGGGLSVVGLDFSPLALGTTAGVLTQTQQQTQQLSSGYCPDTGRTATTFDVVNSLNETADPIDVTVVFTSDSGHVVVITDTTSPTASNLICKDTYIAKGTGTTTRQGSFRGIYAADGVTPTGAEFDAATRWVTFTPTGSDYALSVKGAKASVPQMRIFDLDANGYLNLDTGGASSTDYQSAPNTFESNTNGTALAVGSGGQLRLRLDIRAASTQTDVNDGGVLLAQDAITDNIWDTPVVTLSGQILSQADAEYTKAELGSLSRFNYKYLLPRGTAITNTDYKSIFWTQNALGGINPAAGDDLNFTVITRSGYRSNANRNIVLNAAFQDDPSRTVVIARNEWMVDTS